MYKNYYSFIYLIFLCFDIKFKNVPFSVWAYVGGIVVLAVVGQLINHIKKKSKK
jgi:hypothetical protein